VVGLAATRPLLREDAMPARGRFQRPRGRLLLLGAIAFCAFLLDGAAANWSAVHMRSEQGAGAGVAAGTFTAFALALALGRLAGDRLVARAGRVRVVQGCGLLAAAGAASMVAAPAAWMAVAGWIVLGLGVSVLAPTVLGAASPGPHAPLAIATVSTIGYLGSFTGPPVIGGLAELTGLSAALGLLVLAAAAAALLARPAFRR
jgi:MFS family permease